MTQPCVSAPVITLVDFLLARYADDETDLGQLDVDLGRWERELAINGADGTQGSIIAASLRGGAFDPERALADIKAKRRIVEHHTRSEWGHENDPAVPCHTLRLLALPYADHPDWREEWKP